MDIWSLSDEEFDALMRLLDREDSAVWLVSLAAEH